jgi:hypothetical protein
MRSFRYAMAAGIGFVVLYVVAVFVSFGNSPDIKSHDSDAVVSAKYVKELSDSGHRTGLLLGAYLMVVAALLFLWFTAGLRDGLRSPVAGRLVSAFGGLAAAMLAIGAMANAVFAGAVSFGDEPVPHDGNTIRAVMEMAFPLWFVAFGLSAAAVLVTLAVTGRSAGWPAWLCYTAWLGVLGAIFAVIFLPMALPLLWVLAAAITGLVRANRADAATAPAPAVAESVAG